MPEVGGGMPSGLPEVTVGLLVWMNEAASHLLSPCECVTKGRVLRPDP